jgi:hypothetical protein
LRVTNSGLTPGFFRAYERIREMEVISLNFRITDEWPTPIVRDFDQFLDAVRESSVSQQVNEEKRMLNSFIQKLTAQVEILRV